MVGDSSFSETEGARSGGAEADRLFYAIWALIFLASAAGTIALCESMSGGMAMPGGWTMSMAWMPMGGAGPAGAAAAFLGMWIVMMIAMMAPSLVPTLSGYRDSVSRRAEARDAALSVQTALVVAGYFFVWTLFGAAAYAAGVVLTSAEMRWPWLARGVPVGIALVLFLAGCLQLTAWKMVRLRRCREDSACHTEASSPSSSGRRGIVAAWRHGLRFGAHCSLCCSGFMAVLLAAGVMDLRVMAAVAAAITAERLSPRPVTTARFIGAVMIAGGALGIALVLTLSSSAAR